MELIMHAASTQLHSQTASPLQAACVEPLSPNEHERLADGL